MEEKELIRAINGGDHIAFKNLVQKYHASLLHLARNIVGESCAEDVVQDSWIAIYQGMKQFEGRSSLKTWMFRIVSNKAITRWRKDKNTKFVTSENCDDNDASILDRFDQNEQWNKPLVEWEDSDPAKVLASEELKECIEEVLSGLPENQRAVFALSQIHGQSSSTICNLLEITSSNMKVLLHRARLKLFTHIVNFQENGKC